MRIATICEASSTPAIRRIKLPRWLQPVALAGALLALLVLTISPALEHGRSVMPSAAGVGLEPLPLTARPLVSRTLGRGQAPYAIHRRASGLVATNRAHGLSAHFDAQRVRVRTGGDTLALRLRSVGYGQTLTPIAAAAPAEHANRVSYRRGPVTEWYVNGPLGLEQGFTLKAPPTGAGNGLLTLGLSLSGNLRPALEPGGRALNFAGSSLRYAGLTVLDARGHMVPARLELHGRTLLIRVSDRDARYPLTIDPFVQQARLTTRSYAAFFDPKVAISGNTIVAGLRWADSRTGAVYVFVKPPGGWGNTTETAKLTASDRAVDDDFGYSVAISGDTIVVAAGSPTAAGTAYVFVKPAGGWADATETAKLPAGDGSAIHVVAISGNTIVASGGGAAHVFVKPPAGWEGATETARLTASDGQSIGRIAISGDTIVASVPVGGAHVFVKPAGGWTNATETATLTASDTATLYPSAISGDTIVADWNGADYVFVKPSAGWKDGTQTAKLTASDGHDVLPAAISDDTIVAGGGGSCRRSEAEVYVFAKPAGGWTDGTETQKLTPSNCPSGEYFGYPVAVSDGTIVVASVGRYSNSSAALYVFGFIAPATIAVTKQLSPTSDPGRFDLRVGQTVVKAGAGNGGFGSLDVLPGTYRVTESAVAGTTLSNYSTSIACTLNGNPGPSANATQLDVTVAEDDQLACTITNKRKAQMTLTKHLIPASDPGRFDLKVGGVLVKAAAGEGDSGSTQVVAGTYTLSEVAATGTSLTNYASSIACTRNGGAGPSGTGTSLKVTVGWGDVLACTITNQPGATITLTKDLRPSFDPGRFDLKVAGTVVKAGAGNGGSGSLGVLPGTYRVSESAASGTTLSDYATSIGCTLNGNPGPSADGTPQLDVTVAVGDRLACTLTNRRKAQVTLTKHLGPSSDPGRFDLKLTSSTGVRVVRTSAGDGDSGTIQVAPGTWTVVESAASGTSLSDYMSSIACTRNGNPGPSGNGTSLQVTLASADGLVCTLTNQRK